MELRPYQLSDLPHLLEICLRTGDSGRDATHLFHDRFLVGRYFAAPYAAYDAGLCLILADTSGPCGYVLGTDDTRAFVSWFNRHWLPGLRALYRRVRVPSSAPDHWLFDLMRRPAKVPPCAHDYPAHLHIDLLPRAQGQGWGRRMMQAWGHLAHHRGATGVHLGVATGNHAAQAFYSRVGLQRLESAEEGAVFFGGRLPLGG
jgi:ribosomal protein S18 acetylase RimI-like enzyme